MRKYDYSARNREGAIERGELEAKNRSQVVEALQGKGLIVVKVEEKVSMMGALNEVNIGGVPMNDKVVFMRQLATMMSAGLPLTQSMEILTAQATNPLFKRVLKDVLSDVEEGRSLAKAFGRQPGVFSDIVLNLIKAGEDSGTLEEVFLRLADELENERNFQAKIRSAMIYPIIIMVVIVVTIAMVMIFMIPAISGVYQEFGSELPFVTKILISMSNFTRSYWWIILVALAALVGGFKYYIDTPGGRKMWDNFKLTVPIFGNLNSKIELAQMTSTLHLLVSSGLPILESLELVGESLGNIWFRDALKNAAREVEHGSPLAIPLSREEKIPLVVSQMIGVGEESGSLDVVLEKMSEYYAMEVDIMTGNLATMIEPLMLVIMGGIVAFIAVAVYMPLFSLANVVGG